MVEGTARTGSDKIIPQWGTKWGGDKYLRFLDLQNRTVTTAFTTGKISGFTDNNF
jgi:hypothetical protein